MNEPSSPFPAARSGAHWSARHSPPDCPVCCAEGATPLSPDGVAPTLVSTAPNVPRSASDPLPLASPVAVLTIFEGQAVYRIITSTLADYPKGMLFRLGKGRRDVTGGVRW